MKIAAFNAKNLGWKKVTNKTVVHYLTKIMSQYSVVVILEVMDKSGKAMQKLLKELNNNSSNKNRPYSMTASSRLGRDTYKERFVCFYREDDVKLKACHQYEDNQVGDVDAFAREPFILRFSCPSTKVKDLVLIPVHTKPKDSLKELDELHDVVDAVRKKWRTNKIMILGDFNADGRYLSKRRKKKKIRISSAPYHWLIKDDVDTTTSNCNDHTYDRIVVYRKTMLDAVVPGSAKPFNFQKEFSLTDEQTLSISDHYPVEVELRTKAPAQGPMALPRTTKTTSIKRQTQKKGAQKKRRAKPAGAEKITKAELAGAEKKMKAKPAGAEKKKKKKTEAAGAEKLKKIEAAGADKKKKKTEAAGAEMKKKKAKAKPAGAEKKKKTEAAGAEMKKKTEAAGAEMKKTEAAGAEKKKKKKTEAAGAEMKKKNAKAKPAGAEKKKKKKKKKTEAAGAETKKKTEAAGAEKKKAEAAALQKTKNMTGKRTRGPSSDTPAKRRRLEKCQSNRLSTSCLTQ